MKIRLYMCILYFALVIEIVTANVRLQRSPQQYCGSKLADIMRILCKSNYNENKGIPMGKYVKSIRIKIFGPF